MPLLSQHQVDELPKLDELAVDGLSGVEDSLGYKVNEVERHVHVRERWFGISGDQSGNDWAADNLNAFRAISGNNAYGSDADDEAKVFGSDDTPVISGSAYFDFHKLLVEDVSHDTTYKLRIVYGTGTMADAITALQYTELMVLFDSTNPQLSAGVPIEVRMPRQAAGTQIWTQAWNANDNAWLDFFPGVHEYEG